MTVVDNGVGIADAADHEPSPRRRVRRVRVLTALVVAVAVVAGSGGWWWFLGGTFLHVSSANEGGSVAENELASWGLDMTTSAGPSVVLDGVSAHVPGAVLQWSAFHNLPDADGFGSWAGPLVPTWPVSSVHGYRVAQPGGHPERGATWLIVSLRASQPGVYHLTDVSVTYRSGWRTRTTTRDVSLCVLVYAPADKQRIFGEMSSYRPFVTNFATLDPLVQNYERCMNPTST